MGSYSVAPTPPPGFALDSPTSVQSGAPTPPPGFVLDSPQNAATPPQTAFQTLKNKLRTGATVQEAADPYIGFAKGAVGTAADVSSLLNKIPVVGETLAPKAGVQAFQQAVKPSNAMQHAGAIAEGVGEMAMPIGGGEQAVQKALPSIEHAGEMFGRVAAKAYDVPVEIEHAADAALRLMDWQKKTQLGPTVNKFLQRLTNPKYGPLTYGEARDWYQVLGKLSAEETMKLAPKVRADLVEMVVGLKNDIGNAAGKVGSAKEYYEAMKEYASASRIRKLAQEVGAYTWQQAKEKAPWLIGLYGLKQVSDALSVPSVLDRR